LGFALALLLLGALTWAASWHWVGHVAAAQAQRDAKESLRVQTGALTGLLDRFRALPPILARQNDIAQLLLPVVPQAAVRDKVTELAYLSGAADVALYHRDGTYITSARQLYPAHLSANRATAELLQAPSESRLGRATLVFDAEQRYYAFSSLVGGVQQPVGVLVFFVDLTVVEQAWALSRWPIAVTDAQGRVIVTNTPAWLGQPLSAIWSAQHPQRLNLDGQAVLTAAAEADLPLLGWRIHAFGLSPQLTNDRRLAVLFSLLFTSSLGLGGWLLLRRREQAWAAERKERADALRLERLVQRRTRDLNASNLSLQQEIEERRSAEAKLLAAREEVVRSAKLAAIGQMSTTLSHEYNQPLATISTYAENAERFLERQRLDRVASNLQLIRQQVERMAALSRTLLSFARKAEPEFHPTHFASVVDDAVLLVSPRARKASVALQVNKLPPELRVMGSAIRLTQVLVNLLSNAIDAASSQTHGWVRLDWALDAPWLHCHISDNGPGVPADVREQIFEPFFTTKPAGVGLGIGLSVVADIVRESQGSLRVEDAPGGGAQFSIALRLADAAREAPPA
jgi:two-component system C4-dicarboxylate transport sensor histidine kinase DctB